MRILFADDDAGIQALARLALERIGGFTVEICSTGAEALAKASSFKPNAVVLDVTMPGMDGPETLKALRATAETSDVPVLFLTANTDPREVRRYREMGVLDVVAKPFDPMALSGIVRDLLQKTRSAPSVEKEGRDLLRELGNQYMEQLPGKIAQIEEAMRRLETSWERETLAEAHRLVHSLAGSSSSFGFPAVSDSARLIESLLKAAMESNSPLSHDQWADARSRLDQLKQSAGGGGTETDSLHEAGPSPVCCLPQASADSKVVYLIEKDLNTAGDLSRQIGYFGYTVEIFPSVKGLEEAVARTFPSAVIADMVSTDDYCAAIRVIKEIQQMSQVPIPVIFISDIGDLQMRLLAVRAGGEAFFTRPVDIAKLVDKLDSLTRQRDFEPYRVLIVDDDPLLAERHDLILRNAGMTTFSVTAPLAIMEHLADFRPELILMDVYMPACNGMELAKIIRQREAFVSVPIVFLSSETDIDKQLAAMNLGADDFLTKPILPGHLVSAVTARIERSRTLHSFMIRDSLTGLLNHSRTKEQLDIELARAIRQNSGLIFSIIDIDHFKSVNDIYGHFVGDQVIKGLSRLLLQRLRKTDILGRYGGEEFAAVLHDVSAPQAFSVLDGIRRDFAMIRHQCRDREFYVSFSCGIASFPPNDSCRGIIEDADRALYEAKRSGRNRVMIAAK